MKFKHLQSIYVKILWNKFAFPSVYKNVYHGQRCYVTRISNLYDILQITPKASQSQIKAAYYRLSKKYHPDVNKDEHAKHKFSEIAEAYEILGTKHNKRIYDQNNASRYHTKTVYDVDYQDILKNRNQFQKKNKAPVMGKTDIYDFDEFYRQHYGSYVKFNKDRAAAEKAAQKARIDEEKFQLKKVAIYCTSVVMVLLVTAFYS